MHVRSHNNFYLDHVVVTGWLVALAGWIFWAVGKVEDAKREGAIPAVVPVSPAAPGHVTNPTP
ncbi:hypothetical protein [Verrucomicrobium spinosum]|uniref:hypothetical protein n=1 Tax=Verrucomicrobium spinosum TaxID=2736 RepID=UPI0012E2972D|nr:hypothetical protein [Verrucomicrobium spinosum]